MRFLRATLFLVYHLKTAFGFGDYPTCCGKAIEDKAYLNKSIPQTSYVCDQTYNPQLPPAPNLEVTYGWCISNCGGWGDKAPSIPVERLAPLLQYTLPAVAFSMTIPRRKKVEIPEVILNFIVYCGEHHTSPLSWLGIRNLGLKYLLWPLLILLLRVVFSTIDFIIWVLYVLIMAGPMLFSGLHEVEIDRRILKNLPKIGNVYHRVEVLSTSISGNLDRRERAPQKAISDALAHDLDEHSIETTIVRLVEIMNSQPSFGSSVGGAVLFYAGQFIYTILDIQNKKGDTDTADALAFGMWWMTIVHVSIVAGCLLASNNPSTASTLTGLSTKTEKTLPKTPLPEQRRGILKVLAYIVDHTWRPFIDHTWKPINDHIWKPLVDPIWRPVYPSTFQPVWMFQRGDQKMRWLKDTQAWQQSSFREAVQLRKRDWAALTSLAIFLIFIPAAFAFSVEYLSPKIGLGCRSFTVLVYFLAQVVLIFLTLLKYHKPERLEDYWGKRKDIESVQDLILQTFYYLAGFFAELVALFASVGGTLMEMMGVYQSCICGISVQSWNNDRHNAILFLASDTAGFRASARLWTITGYAAVGIMLFMCYIAYGIQQSVRDRFKDASDGLRELLKPAAPP